MRLPPPVAPRVSGFFSSALDGPGPTRLDETGADAATASKVVSKRFVVPSMDANKKSPLPCALRVDPFLGAWNAPLKHGGENSFKGNTKCCGAITGVEETFEYQETSSVSASDRTEWTTTTVESSDGAGEQLEDVSDFSPPTGRSHRCFETHQSTDRRKHELPVRPAGSPVESLNITHGSEGRLPSTLSADLLLSAASARYCQSAPTPSRSCVKSSVAEKEHGASSFATTRKTVFLPFFLCRTCCTSDADLTQTLEFTTEGACQPSVPEETRGRSPPLWTEDDSSCLRNTTTTGVSPRQLVSQLTAAETYARNIVDKAQEKRKLCIREAQRQAEAEVERFTQVLKNAHEETILLQEQERRTDETHSADESGATVSVVDANVNKAFKIIWSHVLSVDLSMPPRAVAMLQRRHHASVTVESSSKANSFSATNKEPLDAAFSTVHKFRDTEDLRSLQSCTSTETTTSKLTTQADKRLPFVDHAPQDRDSSNVVLIEGSQFDAKVGESYRSSEGQALVIQKVFRKHKAIS